MIKHDCDTRSLRSSKGLRIERTKTGFADMKFHNVKVVCYISVRLYDIPGDPAGYFPL